MKFLNSFFGRKKSTVTKNKGQQGRDPILAFWEWFTVKQKDFYRIVKENDRVEMNLFGPLKQALKPISEHIYYLVGMNDKEEVELIFTSEGVIRYFPLVENLVRQAPQLDNWRIIAHKPASNMEKFAVTMGDYKFTEANIHFFVNHYPEYPDLIDISLVYSDYKEEDKTLILNGCFIFLDNYLGELEFALHIDEAQLVASAAAEGQELIPILKLKDYLIWREKEFVEKYEAIRKDTQNDSFSGLEATLQNGAPLVGVVNQDLLAWPDKPSHPWLVRMDIFYTSDNDSGMPNNIDYEAMDLLEEGLMQELRDVDGYLNIGRQTADGVREVFFAGKDFRKPVAIINQIQQQYANSSLKIDFTVYKDKYWKSLDFFNLAQ